MCFGYYDKSDNITMLIMVYIITEMIKPPTGDGNTNK